MGFLNKLSVRDRFLIAPLIGVFLTIVLYLAANFIIESELNLLRKVNNSNLPLVSEISKASIAMLSVHTELTGLLVSAIDDPDEMQMYFKGQDILQQLFLVQKDLYLLLEVNSEVIVNNLELSAQIKLIFNYYSDVVVEVVEYSAVDAQSLKTQVIKSNCLTKVMTY